MELAHLIEALSEPAAYPYTVETVEVRQTHISVVFLAALFVYKVKKPVSLGFLDFTTLDQRLHFCQEEVRLNRRLASNVYLGVVPLARTPAGVRLEGEGEIVEWAVKMRRLPEEATLLERLRRGEIDDGIIESIARRIATFHASAETNSSIATFGRFEAVSRLILDIFDQGLPQIEITANRTVFDRARALTGEKLALLRPLIEKRASSGMPRDCHGDLHLDHVYYFPEQTSPADLVIIDCIEFNSRFRYIDPVADMAFAAMDLAFHGRRDLADTFAAAYFTAANDDAGRTLLPLYTAYRAAVRGMVEGLLLREREVPETERAAALARSRAHWLLALTQLETPGRRPCLVLVTGLPGSGKSTLARALSECAEFKVIRSDVVRKELANLPANEPSPAHTREFLYSAEWNARTYQECLSRAERLLAEGRRVIVDATFREERYRRTFLNAAIVCGVPAVILLCQANPDAIKDRLDKRVGDASDADTSLYEKVASDWEDFGPDVKRVLNTVSAGGAMETTLAQALDALRQRGLWGNE